MIKENVNSLSTNDAETVSVWKVEGAEGKEYDWNGFYTGPLVLEEQKIAELCQRLLGANIADLTTIATAELRPVPSLKSVGASIIMHSTTPDLKTFDGDLDKIVKGVTPTDYTSYKEGRAVYLASTGDLAVGRIQPWKTAVELGALDAVEVPYIGYYYLSHALLMTAEEHLKSPSPEINKILDFLKEHKDATIRLYALEKEMQIFLIWLKRLAKLDHLLMDANSPTVARDWNRKSILFPTVAAAFKLAEKIKNYTPHEILKEEAMYSLLREQLGCEFPVMPGYTIVNRGNSLAVFTEQLLTASKMLQERYGLTLGCLKAADSGDGARITPNVTLSNVEHLTALAKDAHRHGDDYILEPHVNYHEVVQNEECLKVVPSAHIRWGEVATGITLQFTEGTSWKGNIYVDEKTADDFGVSAKHLKMIDTCMDEFLGAFSRHALGLTIAGLDFAIGRIGGLFGDELLMGVQDPNVSFSGAECLRVFLEKMRKEHKVSDDEVLYGVTRIIKPSRSCNLSVLRKITAEASHSGIYVDAIAAIPERWAMVAVAHADSLIALKELEKLQADLLKKGLLLK